MFVEYSTLHQNTSNLSLQQQGISKNYSNSTLQIVYLQTTW